MNKTRNVRDREYKNKEGKESSSSHYHYRQGRRHRNCCRDLSLLRRTRGMHTHIEERETQKT